MNPSVVMDGEDSIDVKRAFNLKGLGVVFCLGGAAMGFLWVQATPWLEGRSGLPAEQVGRVFILCYAAFAAAPIGYWLSQVLPARMRNEGETTGPLTADWLVYGLIPSALYVALSTAALVLMKLPARGHAHLQAGLAAVVALYGVWLLMRRLSPRT